MQLFDAYILLNIGKNEELIMPDKKIMNLKSFLISMFAGFVPIFIISCNDDEQYAKAQNELSSLYPLKAPPQEGDWLYTRNDKYQTLAEYQESKPISIDSERKKIYIMLIGDFDSARTSIVKNTATYLETFYGLETVFIEMEKNADILTKSRNNPFQGQLQLSAKQIMNVVLKTALPKDAALLIGLTTYDLYPENNWNFIFGLGSTKERVGVWSMYRFGDPNKVEERNKCFMLTAKTATHEIGHMFSLRHCAKYACCMNGSNSLRESLIQPIYFCPDCLAKICWNLKQDVKDNLSRTKTFWEERNDSTLVNFYNKSMNALH